MNINIPVEDSKRPLDCPLCGGIPEIRVSKTAYSGNNRMDTSPYPARMGMVLQRKAYRRSHAETVGRLGGQNRVDSLVADSPVPMCGRMPHVNANNLGLNLDCGCGASSNPVSDPVAAVELWERNIEKRKRLNADAEFLNGIISRSSRRMQRLR